ncbi:juvenile hormone acid O-methyltransferase-like [Ixodes scapularis]
MADSSNAAPNDSQRLIPASMPDSYAQRNTFQRKMNITALEFFQPTLAHRPNLNQQFLDVGCGTGDFTKTELLPRCQPCQRIVATDTILKMIEYARKNFAHPQIAYEEHDIRGDVSGLIAKYGQFDRVYSFYALNWVQDQTTALRNIGNLMKDDGDCFLCLRHERLCAKFGRGSSRWIAGSSMIRSRGKYRTRTFGTLIR